MQNNCYLCHLNKQNEHKEIIVKAKITVKTGFLIYIHRLLQYLFIYQNCFPSLEQKWNYIIVLKLRKLLHELPNNLRLKILEHQKILAKFVKYHELKAISEPGTQKRSFDSCATNLKNICARKLKSINCKIFEKISILSNEEIKLIKLTQFGVCSSYRLYEY